MLVGSEREFVDIGKTKLFWWKYSTVQKSRNATMYYTKNWLLYFFFNEWKTLSLVWKVVCDVICCLPYWHTNIHLQKIKQQYNPSVNKERKMILKEKKRLSTRIIQNIKNHFSLLVNASNHVVDHWETGNGFQEMFIGPAANRKAS